MKNSECQQEIKDLQEKLTKAENLLSRLPRALTKDGVEVIAYVSTVWFWTTRGEMFSSHKWQNGSPS